MRKEKPSDHNQKGLGIMTSIHPNVGPGMAKDMTEKVNSRAGLKSARKNTQKNGLKTMLAILAYLLKLAKTELSPTYGLEETPVTQNEWKLDTLYALPPDTTSFVADYMSYLLLPTGYPSPTTWTTLIDPMMLVRLNKEPKTEANGFDPNADFFVSVSSRWKYESSQHHYGLVVRVRDSSGLIFEGTHPHIESSRWGRLSTMYFKIYIRTDPTVIIVEFYSNSFYISLGQDYELSLKEASQMRVSLMEPAQDKDTEPYGAIRYYGAKFITFDDNRLKAEGHEEYHARLEMDYLMWYTNNHDEAFTIFLEFDFTPRSNFNELFESGLYLGLYEGSNYQNEVIETRGDYLGEKAYIACLKDCKYVKDPKDHTISVYLRDNSYMKNMGFSGQRSLEYFEHSLYSEGYQLALSTLVWVKLMEDTGDQMCNYRGIFMSLGIQVVYDSKGRLGVINGYDETDGVVQTGLFIKLGRWYSIGIGTKFWRDEVADTDNTFSLLVVNDIAENTSTHAYVKTSTSWSSFELEYLGVPGCSAKMMIKYVVTTKNYLAPPDDNCPTFAFYVRAPTGFGWSKKCLEDYLVGYPEEERYFDNDIQMYRKRPECEKMMVKTPEGCRCTPGTEPMLDQETQEESCRCLNEGTYYDWNERKCFRCPLDFVVDETGFGCVKKDIREIAFYHKYDENLNQLKIIFKDKLVPLDYAEAADNGELSKRVNIEIEGKEAWVDYKWKLQFGKAERNDAVLLVNFEFLTPMDYMEVKFSLISSINSITPDFGIFETGPADSGEAVFNSMSDSVSPQVVQIAQEAIMVTGVLFPSFFERMPFLLFFFSFLRTLNYYPVKIPLNLHKFLNMFYIDYRDTYGYRIVNYFVKRTYDVKEDYYLDPPKLKIKNRHGITISRVLYFSNTIPVVSLVSKIGLLWYLIKVFKQLRKATVTKISKIEQERKKMTCFQIVKDFVFRKIITFIIIKIHIDIYGRLIYIFTAFGGFMEVMEYNKAVCFINIAEALLDFSVMVWIELKIYTFLKGSTAVQLLMLDVKRLKSVLMVDIFIRKSDNSHSATYLCIQNFCIFLLASTLVVFQKFVEVLFMVHIIIILFLVSYCFLSKDKFKYKIDFFIYLSNNIGFSLIVIMFSFFMYYDDYEPESVALFGFLVQIGIIILMFTKIVVLFVKTFRMYRNWRESRKRNSAVKDFVKEARRKKAKGVIKKRGEGGRNKRVKPPTYDQVMGTSGRKKKVGSGNSSSQLFKFVMENNASKANLGSMDDFDKNFGSNDHLSQRATGEIKRVSGDKKMDADKLMPSKMSVRLRRGSIRSGRGSVMGKRGSIRMSNRSIMSISSKMKTIQPKSRLGIKLDHSRMKRKSKSEIPMLDSNLDLVSKGTKRSKKESKKASLKEIDEDLFSQLQDIQDEELRKRGTMNIQVEGIKVNSKGTFSSHSSEYYDEDKEDLNSIIENTYKGESHLHKEAPKSHFSPFASPKNKPSKITRGFSIAVNGTHQASSSDLKKFVFSSNNLKEESAKGSKEKLKIVKKLKLTGPRRSIMVSRMRRNNSTSVSKLKDRVNMRRGSMRLSLNIEDKEEGKKKQASFNELKSHRAMGKKHNTFSGQINYTIGEENSPGGSSGWEASPSPSGFKRNFLRDKHSTVKQSRFMKVHKDSFDFDDC